MDGYGFASSVTFDGNDPTAIVVKRNTRHLLARVVNLGKLGFHVDASSLRASSLFFAETYPILNEP